VLRAAVTPGVAGDVFNVAMGSRISLNQLLAALQTLAGTSLQPIYAPSRSGDVRDSQANIAKAERLLGYRPIVSFEEGLKRTLAWFEQTS
jgi:nucleoside-diphosphate-sugar epimerase